jgi:hypothetical protein
MAFVRKKPTILRIPTVKIIVRKVRKVKEKKHACGSHASRVHSSSSESALESSNSS